MRSFLNGILSFIGSESLTDAEFQTINLSEQAYNAATYEALKLIVQGREGVTGQLKKLKNYFSAKGVDLTGVPARTPSSQILIGGPL